MNKKTYKLIINQFDGKFMISYIEKILMGKKYNSY